jgi:hypothetical protein
MCSQGQALLAKCGYNEGGTNGGRMKPLCEMEITDLVWTQPSPLKREYELRCGEEVMAALRWGKVFGSLAIADAAEGCWTFKRSGFLSPRVTVRLLNTEFDMAVFKPGWSGSGPIVFTNGRVYNWGYTHFWQKSWSFTNDSGQRLVRFTPEASLVNFCIHVEIDRSAQIITELPVLAIFGVYLMILMADESASSDAAGAAAAG